MKKNLIARRIKLNYQQQRLIRYAGFIDSIKEIANQGKEKFFDFLKTNCGDVYETVSKWSKDLQNAFSEGIKQLSQKLQELNTYMNQLSPDERDSIINAIDELLEPLVGPNALEITGGVLAIGKAIVQTCTTGVPPQMFVDICTGIDMLMNSPKPGMA